MPERTPRAWLIDRGRRLHLQEGPIDVIIEAIGPPARVCMAYERAVHAFEGLLQSLVEELAVLRHPLGGNKAQLRPSRPTVQGPVARRMIDAAWPLARFDVTPMIAVAGAVADHLLESMRPVDRLQRLMVNNGGDIALHLGADAGCRIGVCADPLSARLAATVQLQARDGVRGVATSGWQGRSHSLGVADAVTVLADCAAGADAAATVVANAVNVPESPRIRRRSACELDPDTDLGHREVTVGVDTLTTAERGFALAAGVACARELTANGSVHACYLCLQGETRIVEMRCQRTRAVLTRRSLHRQSGIEPRDL